MVLKLDYLCWTTLHKKWCFPLGISHLLKKMVIFNFCVMSCMVLMWNKSKKTSTNNKVRARDKDSCSMLPSKTSLINFNSYIPSWFLKPMETNIPAWQKNLSAENHILILITKCCLHGVAQRRKIWPLQDTHIKITLSFFLRPFIKKNALLVILYKKQKLDIVV